MLIAVSKALYFGQPTYMHQRKPDFGHCEYSTAIEDRYFDVRPLFPTSDLLIFYTVISHGLLTVASH